VTTPRCPPGRALVAGGFDFGGSYDALFAEGYFTRKGTWSATGFGWFGPAELTAYGYCLKASDTVDRAAFPAQRVEPAESAAEEQPTDEDSDWLIYVALALAGFALAAWLIRRRRRIVRRRRANRRRRARHRADPR